MNTRISITGRNSGDIYHLSFPTNLLYFMKYDFNIFMERCVDLCKHYMKTGEYRQEEAAEIRNSISGCHKFFEQNLRGIFEKIVIDCFIEYICRQNEIGVITLWNEYIPCRNDFEKAVFMRLSEYRHGHAINQWVNVLKIQEYANIKTEFIFGGKLKSPAEAAARSNYFDLMFNVVANELGHDLNMGAENKVFSAGRTPNSPFILNSVSREIVRSLLVDLHYSDEKVKSIKNDAVSDQTAMDVFASMKLFLPSHDDNVVETMIKSLARAPMKVYMPVSLKAAVDLEMDAIIENGAYLQRCELCKDYFMRSEDYDYDYCDKVSKNGVSCFEKMASKNSNLINEKKIAHDSIDAALLNERCDRLYKEMSSRINVEFTQRDFSDWCRFMNAIRDNILNGQASIRDFENFAEYSRSMSFLPGVGDKEKEESRAGGKNPTVTKDSRGRTVKPFVFERVSREDVKKPETRKRDDYYYDDDNDEYEEEETLSNNPVSRVSSKIIRGLAPDSYSSGITIPYGKEKERINDTLPKSRLSGVRQQRRQDKFKNTENEPRTAEKEDVKIYNAKNNEPEKPEEYVKVFNPKKITSGTTKTIKPINNDILKTLEPNENIFKEDDFYREEALYKPSGKVYDEFNSYDEPYNIKKREKPHIPAFPSFPAANEESSPPPAISLSIPKKPQTARTSESRHALAEKSKNIHAAKSQISGIEKSQIKPAITPTQPLPPALSKMYASQKTEETSEIGFADILRGLERKDGFADDNIPTDSEGVPVSHKTKRVMDAIFKQSKPNLFININKDD